MEQKFAQQANSLDQQYMYATRRHLFHIPQHAQTDCIYFCGNSLGLQPKSVQAYLQQELDDWARLGVEGHFEGKNAWFSYHRLLTDATARLVGACPHEVVVMNSLTVNLHLLMVSFYRPTAQRYRIIIEGGAFPSDRYAVQTQAQWHGFDPAQAVVELLPRAGEHCLRTDDICRTIEHHADQLSLVLLGGVNYYTGQWYDLPAVTQAAHQVGAVAGFDLAHAAGNVPLQLHDAQVDFAAWCGYKYLNSGPGGSSGVFIHEQHVRHTQLLRWGGWWGNDPQSRFTMPQHFTPYHTAEGWQLSNAQVLSMAAHRAALDIFDEVGIDALRQKSVAMSDYLFNLLDHIDPHGQYYHIITPRHAHERGCQVSLLMQQQGKAVFEYLSQQGVVADWRHPNVIRIAPVPLYNSFDEIYRFAQLLEAALLALTGGAV